jgi:hypothetical protein
VLACCSVGCLRWLAAAVQEVQSMQFNILVTTYETIMRDRSKLSKLSWKYIIIDEAQRMKDRCDETAAYMGNCTVPCTAGSGMHRLLHGLLCSLQQNVSGVVRLAVQLAGFRCVSGSQGDQSLLQLCQASCSCWCPSKKNGSSPSHIDMPAFTAGSPS